jgi:hypothetical protein
MVTVNRRVGERRAPGQPVAFVGRSFPGCLDASGRATQVQGSPVRGFILLISCRIHKDAPPRERLIVYQRLKKRMYATASSQNMAAHRTVDSRSSGTVINARNLEGRLKCCT